MGVRSRQAVLIHSRMILNAVIVGSLALLGVLVNGDASPNKTEVESNARDSKALSVFNVVTFPNTACGASTGYNGTCYTASECISKGGTASGSCASSFGVCCVFNLACGGSTTQNNTYAIISSYSTSSDADPCAYTVCKQNADVCKLRIDFDTMVLQGPYATTTAAADGPKLSDCFYDTLTVSNPGGTSPPVICGYNTGQHMFVPASDACNTINIDIDTGTTTTTRKWQIKVTQYECGNLMAPDQDCLQYHTAQVGTIASFNWDISTTTVATTQLHLSSQYYSVCIRRTRGQCSVCFTPEVIGTADGIASSYGLGGSSIAAIQTGSVGATCTGITTQPGPGGAAYGDYLEIANLQPTIGTSGTTTTGTRICGAVFNAIANIAQATACSFAIPFKVGVHFDDGEAIHTSPLAAPNLNKAENDPAATVGAGYGYSGFWLTYWQNAC